MNNSLDLSVKLGPLVLKNPLFLASGTWGWGKELEPYIDLSSLGGLITKGISLHPREGNPPPRIAEVSCGLVNAIGLENPGVKKFKEEILPSLRSYKTTLLVNILGETLEEYEAVVEELKEEDIEGIEINISCPNVKKGGLQFGQDPEMVELLIKRIRNIYDKFIVVKLSPVGPVLEIAQRCIKAGAEALTIANTWPALVIDIHQKKPFLAQGFGGLSGPAIKPLTLRLVYQIYKELKAPIIGCGGISSGTDMLEYLLAGASAVQIGTATLLNPYAPYRILEEFSSLLERKKIPLPSLPRLN